MALQNIFILISLLVFIALLCCIVYAIPFFIIKIWGKSFGLNLNWREVKSIRKNKCYRNSFYKDLSKIYEIERFPIEKLTRYYFLTGNFENLYRGLKFAKANYLNVEIDKLLHLDLAGKDIENEMKDFNIEREFEIAKLENKYVRLNLKIKYKLNFCYFWADKNIPFAKEKIKAVLQQFLDQDNHSDLTLLKYKIGKNVLNSKFWKDNLPGEIIKQTYTIQEKI